MRAVYRNPKELATKLKDVVDLYQDDLLSYEKLTFFNSNFIPTSSFVLVINKNKMALLLNL